MDSKNFAHVYEIRSKGLCVAIDYTTIKFDINDEDSWGNRLTTDEYVCLTPQTPGDKNNFIKLWKENKDRFKALGISVHYPNWEIRYNGSLETDSLDYSGVMAKYLDIPPSKPDASSKEKGDACTPRMDYV